MFRRSALILLGTTAASFLYLTSVPASAENNVDELIITIPVSCNLTSTVDSAHNATIANGTYKQDIGITTFTTFCNDDNGYSIYAVGYSNDTFGNNKLLNMAGDVSADIITGTNTSGDTSNWSMKLSPVAGSFAPTIENGYTNYSIIPTTSVKVATFPSITDRLVGSKFQSTYAVYASGMQRSGTYVGKVKYTFVHPASENPLDPIECPANKICYSPNASSIADSMGDQIPYDIESIFSLMYNIQEEAIYIATLKYFSEVVAPECFNNNKIAIFDPDNGSFQAACVDNSSVTINNTFSEISETFSYFSPSNTKFGVLGPSSFATIEIDSFEDGDIESLVDGIPCTQGVSVFGLCVYASDLPPSTKTQLLASNFQRIGYGFLGWKDQNGNLYGPNQTIDLSTIDLSTSGLALYANWKLSSGEMQNWTGCSNLNIGDTVALTDNRDHNTYAIAKLADGNCWMIENLRLGSGTQLNASNTDNSVITAIPASAASNSWCSQQTTACIDQLLINTDNTSGPVASATDHSQKIYSYGNYYNWYTATGGSMTNDVTEGIAPGSICPSGWKLPSGIHHNVSIGDLYPLISANGIDFTAEDILRWEHYSSTDPLTVNPRYAEIISKLTSYPNNFLITSGVYQDVLGFGSAYWASGDVSTNSAAILRLDGSYIDPGAYYHHPKYYGFSVRCIARDI